MAEYAVGVLLTKGGVGKTLTSVGLAVALEQGGMGPILLADFDPQSSTTSQRLRQVDEANKGLSADNIGDSEWATYSKVWPFRQTELSLPESGREMDPQQLAGSLKAMAGGTYSQREDVGPPWMGEWSTEVTPVIPKGVIIDGPPGRDEIIGGVLEFLASQDRGMVVIPSTLDDLDLEQLILFYQTVVERYPSLPVRMLLNRVDSRNREHMDRLEALQADPAFRTFQTVIPASVKIARGLRPEYQGPKSDYVRLHRLLAGEILGELFGGPEE